MLCPENAWLTDRPSGSFGLQYVNTQAYLLYSNVVLWLSHPIFAGDKVVPAA